jgi:peptide deformylase
MNAPKRGFLVPISFIPKGGSINTEMDYQDIEAVLKVQSELEAIVKRFNGTGCSAVQIGYPINVFVLDVTKFPLTLPLKWTRAGRFWHLANCEYTPVKGFKFKENKVVSNEGCLSIKRGKPRYRVSRWKTVNIEGYYFQNNKYHKFNLLVNDIPLSCAFQHEIDHQKGILISDIGRKAHK